MKKFFSVLIFIGLIFVCKSYAFDFITFTPTSYSPQPQPDYSILQRSVQQIENRAYEAEESYMQLLELYNEIGSEISPSEKQWYEHNAGGICKKIKDVIENGNYESAIRMSRDAMKTLRDDKEILYRRDSYKQYCKDMFQGYIAFEKNKVDKRTYDYWLFKNQYEFKPKYDSEGVITGYIPVSVSWLYENIDWIEVYGFVTSNGMDISKIENMWNLYFFGSSKLSSLLQEFEVDRFYFDFYTNCIEREDLDTQKKKI